jgi:hypothetical protein
MANKIGIPGFGKKVNYPFAISLYKVGLRNDGKPSYNLAVNYHSHLYSGLKLKENYLDYERIKIEEFSETGLDFLKPVPDDFPGKNFYCVLEININDLKATDANIQWVIGDTEEQLLAPVVFEDSENYRQTKARIILGVLVSDRERSPGLDPTDIRRSYIVQYIYTHLMMCNMVFDGVPVVYPVPFGGGRLNFGLPE